MELTDVEYARLMWLDKAMNSAIYDLHGDEAATAASNAFWEESKKGFLPAWTYGHQKLAEVRK